MKKLEDTISIFGKGKITALKEKALKEIEQLKKIYVKQFNSEPEVIADIGANIGIYSIVLLELFSNAKVYGYEANSDLHNCLLKLKKNNRYELKKYGLLDENKFATIGLPDNNKNIGCYSILYDNYAIEAEFRNANEEDIKPELIKIDVEGSEHLILMCDEYFENTKMIFIEIDLNDSFGSKSKIKKALKKMKFKYVENTSKNNQIWIRQ